MTTIANLKRLIPARALGFALLAASAAPMGFAQYQPPPAQYPSQYPQDPNQYSQAPQGYPQGYPQGSPQGYPQGYPQGQNQAPPQGYDASAQPGQAPGQPMLSPDQLDGLVAPIALYPDPLLSQILVASTYPLEVVEAGQFLAQNPGLQGQQLLQAAQQQNWDPSVQALVVFPSVVQRLSQDVRWMTDLGNAFLAQQADVMSAIQNMRSQAQAAGKLNTTPQEQVSTQDVNGQQAIEIEPSDPQQFYVPDYNPAYFWGDAYNYPDIYYPGIGVGWGFGPAISLGFYFGGGCCGWGGWGWAPNWYGHSVFLNGGFFHRYRFGDFHGAGLGRSVWMHNPDHRLGVPYGNRAVAQRFGGVAAGRGYADQRAYSSGFRGSAPNAYRGNENVYRGNTGQGQRSFAAPAAGTERLGNRQIPEGNFGSHSAFGPIDNGSRTRTQSDHGYSSMHSAPQSHPSGGGGGGHSFGGGGHASGGGGGHSSGGGGGRH